MMDEPYMGFDCEMAKSTSGSAWPELVLGMRNAFSKHC